MSVVQHCSFSIKHPIIIPAPPVVTALYEHYFLGFYYVYIVMIR